MAIGKVVSRRYAKALFEVAKEQDIVHSIGEELQFVVGSVKEYAEFEKLLKHPNLNVSVKIDLLQQVFGPYIGEVLMNTLEILIRKRRETILPDLLEFYLKIADDALGQAKATVYSPLPLNEQEINQLSEKFSQMTGKKVIIDSVIRKELLGGVQIRIGDRLIDGSLSGKLIRLKKYLNQPGSNIDWSEVS